MTRVKLLMSCRHRPKTNYKEIVNVVSTRCTDKTGFLIWEIPWFYLLAKTKDSPKSENLTPYRSQSTVITIGSLFISDLLNAPLLVEDNIKTYREGIKFLKYPIMMDGNVELSCTIVFKGLPLQVTKYSI